MKPEDILPTYNEVAETWDLQRNQALFERKWLDRMLNYAPGKNVLDLGCGAGRPIASYLLDRRATLTGLDGAPAMIALFQTNLPQARGILADMRGVDLGETFDAILAWNSFFHLSPDDQRAMFEVFARHSAPGAALMFTSGPEEGEEIGEVAGHSLYHSSLSPSEYEGLLNAYGFKVKHFRPEDPECAGHTIWLAQFTS
jgi:cyclopropane fatty-acyl-phospholipid synthase-like methyltransferase